MTAAARWSDLPTEVTAARRGLERLLVEAGTPVVGPDPVPGAPSVAVVGAPGRGRRALAAALLDLGPAAVGDADRLTAADLDVPLLDELDLLLPARPRSGAWATGTASALLVVASAGAPLDRDELDRLAEVAGRVEAVVFALVGTEAHRGWRTVLDADRELVAEHVPRLADAPWFPVSPALAVAARGTGTDGAPLRVRAGLAPLQQHLHRLVARRRRMLDEANGLRRALTTAGARAPAPVARGDTGLRREAHVRWRSGIAAARVAVVDDLARRVRALAARHRERIDHASRAELASLGTDLARDLETVADAAVGGLGDRLRELVVETLAGLLTPADLAAVHIPAPVPPAAPPDGGPRAADRMLVVAGASTGLGLSRLALLPLLAVPVAPVVGAALVPVSVGLGLGAAGWLARVRRRAADRAHARAWLAEALGQARTDLERVLSDALIVAEREITLALDRALDERLDADRADLTHDRALERRLAEATARAAVVLDRLAAARAT
ncbi:hypothetical protein [Actinomycetospora termitidis]|uniref:Uncharacterized protein n=1 Tax=Actinomycetospora termitidis TaxID=3053470 RepID=A0ABT7M474_9PSEU|nr:hypothetical protein [Actinomycetospora sp. Odt1-22]MDL5155024.1 hypothetical protein [Actinomycetospora sp. Odt1-22]